MMSTCMDNCPKDINSDAEILEPEILDNKMWITI